MRFTVSTALCAITWRTPCLLHTCLTPSLRALSMRLKLSGELQKMPACPSILMSTSPLHLL